MTISSEGMQRERIASLVQQGARGFDAASIQLVEALIDRAAQCNSKSLATHLEQRAEAHLSRLEAAFASARERAARTLTELLAATELTASAEMLSHAFKTGAFERVQRAARVLHSTRGARPLEPLARQRLRLEASADRRGIARDGFAQATDLEKDTMRLAAALYRDSAASARARRIVARAAASIPIDAGHYNAQRVAARLLGVLSAYPPYLKAQLARLEALALLEPLAPPKSKPARAKSQGRKDRRAT